MKIQLENNQSLLRNKTDQPNYYSLHNGGVMVVKTDDCHAGCVIVVKMGYKNNNSYRLIANPPGTLGKRRLKMVVCHRAVY